MTHETWHAEWEDRLAFYAAGTLPPADRAALEQHLTGCPACRAALESWRGLGEIVKEQAAQWARLAPPLSDAFRARLSAPPRPSTNGHSARLARLDVERTRRGHGTPAPRLERRWGVPLTMVAALAALLIGALALSLALNRGDESAHLAAPVASAAATHTPTPTPTLPRATEVAAVLDGAETPGWDLGILPTYTPAGSAGGTAGTPSPTRCTVNVIGGSPAPVYGSPESASRIVAWLQPGVFYLALRKTGAGWLEVGTPDGAVLGWTPGALVARFGACDFRRATSSAPAATPAAQFGSSIGGGYNLLTRERIGPIPQGARVRISHAWYEGGTWMYFIVQDDELTTAEAREDQLDLAPGYDPSQPTPTARFDAAFGAGDVLILLETVDGIPAGTRVGIGSTRYDGVVRWYGVRTADGASAEVREDQLAFAPGYDPARPTPSAQPGTSPDMQPTAAPSPTLPPDFTQWAEGTLGVRFDYPIGWYVDTVERGQATAVTLTTFDPASPPPMAAWGPGTLELTIADAPDAAADLLEWVEAERAQLAADDLEIYSDEAITLPGWRYEGWRLVVFSGAGHSITQLYTEIDGQMYQITYTGDSDLAASVIATLRSTR